MSRAEWVVRNSAILLAGQAVSRTAGLVTFMVLTRRLSVAEVGIFGYATALIGFMALAVDFGFDLVVTRDVAAGGGRGASRAALRLKTVMFVVFYPLLLLSVWGLADASPALGVTAVLGGAVWHESMNRTVTAMCLGRGRAEYGLSYEALSAVLRLAGVVGVLWIGWRVLGVAAAYAAASAVSTAVLATVLWRRGLRLGPASAGEGTGAWWLLREAAGFAVYALLFQVYFRVDIVALGAVRPAAEVGQYVAAFRVIETLLIVPAVTTGALFPVLSSLYSAADNARFARACHESTRWLAFIGLGLALASGVAAPLVVRVIAGTRYDEAARYLQLLLPAFGLISVNCVGLLALNAMGYQRWSALIMLVGAVTKFAWTMAFVPRYGAAAACVGTVVTESVVTLGIITAVQPWFPWLSWVRAWRGAAVGAVLAAVTVVSLAISKPVLALFVAGTVFSLASIATGAVRRGDIAMFRRLLLQRSI